MCAATARPGTRPWARRLKAVGALFPFEPDWSQAVKVSRDFKTDIIVSRSGKEMRRALRNSPRKSFEYKVTVTGADARALQDFLVLNQASQVFIADPTQSAFSTTDLGIGYASVAVGGTMPAWLAPGAVVALRNGCASALATVGSVTGAVVDLVAAVAQDWPAGTRITPAYSGRLKAKIASGRPTSTVTVATIQFDVDPGSNLDGAPPAATQFFNSRELVLLTPNWGESVSNAFGHDFEVLDQDRGVVGYYQPIAYASRTWQATYLGANQAAMAAIEQWFERAKGRRGEFYMPTFSPDMLLASAIGATDTVIQVLGGGVLASYATDTVFRALMVQNLDGVQAFAKITGMIANGANTEIQLAAPLGVAFSLSDVQMVSWMPVWRHASDTMTSEWVTDGVAQNQLSLQTVEDLTP
jgi:hypothetical protein